MPYNLQSPLCISIFQMEETDSTEQFRVPRRGSVRRRETEREVRRRVQAGANAWRAVDGVMADRRISK